MSYPRNVHFQPCTLTGANGAALAAGTVLALDDDGEDALRAVVVQNGLFKVTYELFNPGTSEPAQHHPYLNIDGTWTRLSHENYGDWSFFVAPIEQAYDEMEVITATHDVVEIAWRVTAHALNIPYLSNYGVTDRDADGGADYFSNATPKPITSLRVTKLMRMERGLPGYFMAWHSEPRCAPSLKSLLAGPGSIPENNESDFGEREWGPGERALVVFSSNPLAGSAYMPDWYARSVWAQAVIDTGQAIPNHAWWAGIDDATYGVMAHAGYVQTQGAGFPRQQLTGPWWIADIDEDGNVRITCQQDPLEAACWGFTGGHYNTTNHFMHSHPGTDGRMRKYQGFYTGLAYTPDSSNNYANEPTQALRDRIDAIAAALVWPQ